MQQWIVLFNRFNEVWAYRIEAEDSGQAVDIAEARIDTPTNACIACLRPEQLEEFEQKLYKPIIYK